MKPHPKGCGFKLRLKKWRLHICNVNFFVYCSTFSGDF